MKKKFLSLMMAAAVVATTSVSAFAAELENVISGPEGDTYESEIEMTGDVLGEGGTSVPGTLTVTVPTTASFTVNERGEFSAAKIKIKNSGTQNIQVSAYEFVDINGKDVGINVKKASELTSQPRNNIALNIYGNGGIAYLSSETANRGVFKNPDLTQPADSDDGVKLATINARQTGELTLHGEAGSEALTKPAKDLFTLKLKIKKV